MRSGCLESLQADGTSGVNFTNLLRPAFTLIDPESVKKIEN